MIKFGPRPANQILSFFYCFFFSIIVYYQCHS